jgi:hypothetical protein
MPPTPKSTLTVALPGVTPEEEAEELFMARG